MSTKAPKARNSRPYLQLKGKQVPVLHDLASFVSLRDQLPGKKSQHLVHRRYHHATHHHTSGRPRRTEDKAGSSIEGGLIRVWGQKDCIYMKMLQSGIENKGTMLGREILETHPPITETLYQLPGYQRAAGTRYLTVVITTFPTREAFKEWLKKNSQRWGDEAAHWQTSPFVVQGDEFVGGYDAFAAQFLHPPKAGAGVGTSIS